jgi:serine/threonine-protein kinase
MQRLGPYALEECIAVGGMGKVWRSAHVEQPSRQVAVKTLLTGSEARRGELERFVDEARIGALLSHRNVVRTLDVGLDGQQLYLVMELLDGATLSALAPVPGKPLPHGLVLGIALQVLEGLRHAHEAIHDGKSLHVVHRDIKGSNIFITRDGVVKIIDFGIARSMGSGPGRTAAGLLAGSCGYIPPERVKGEPGDGRCDLFALGVVMHEQLTGRRLFDCDNVADQLSAMMFRPIPPVRSRRPEVPVAVEAALDWALKKEISERAPSAAALASRLRSSVPPEQIWTEKQIAEWASLHHGLSSPRETLSADGLPSNSLAPLSAELPARPPMPMPPAPPPASSDLFNTAPTRADRPGDTVATEAPLQSHVPTRVDPGATLDAASPDEPAALPPSGELAERPGPGIGRLAAAALTVAALVVASAAAVRWVLMPAQRPAVHGDEKLAERGEGAPRGDEKLAERGEEKLGVRAQVTPEPPPRPVPTVRPLAAERSQRPATTRISTARGGSPPARSERAAAVNLAEPARPSDDDHSDRSRGKARAKPTAAEGLAFLTVNSRPGWARITTGEAELGPTPIFRQALPPGHYVLDATRADGQHRQREVVLKPGEEERVWFEW